MGRGVLFDFGELLEFGQNRLDQFSPFLDVLHFATAEHDLDENLVVVFEEFLRLVHFGFDIVIAGGGTEANFLHLLLVSLCLDGLLRLREAELAVIHDLANGRTLSGSHLNQIEVRLASQIQRLLGGNDAEVFSVRTDQADGTETNLFVNTGIIAIPWTRGCCIAIGRRNRQSPSNRGIITTEPSDSGAK